MILENELERSAPSGGLVTSACMRLLFQAWIENEQVAQRWQEDKARATHDLEQYLETYAVVLAEKSSSEKQACSDWLEQSMNKLEALEKLQLKQCFVVARVDNRHHTKKENKETQTWINAENEWLINIEGFDSENKKILVFMPDSAEPAHSGINITDIFRQGLTYTRAFLNILNLSEIADIDWICSRLELQLQLFKNHIHTAWELQRNDMHGLRKNKTLKDALSAYNTLLLKLSKMLVEGGIYRRKKYAREGIIYMAEFLWAQNFECASIHVQHASNRANIMVFEPRFVKGSGNKEASWVKKLSGTHPWIKNLPWQILQKPRSSMNRDSEGLKLEKVTLVLIKKDKVGRYTVDCIPIGELGGISVPLAMDNLAERYAVTVANQRGVYLGSQTYSDDPPFTKLEETISAQIALITPILTEKRRKKGITIALTDISLSQGIFPHATNASWMHDAVRANKEIRSVLKRYAVYYDDLRSTYIYLDKTSDDFSALEKKAVANEDYIPI